MNQIRSCGCKGCRTCLQCEQQYDIKQKDFGDLYKKLSSMSYCPECNKLYKGWNVWNVISDHPHHNNEMGKSFAGIYIDPNFLSEEEEHQLMKGIDGMPWDISQSGRRKQNFGPKTNFKKMKISLGKFEGFPEFSKFVQEKFKETEILRNFQTIEQCSLEYDPSKGASIDPHIDDCWIWGERVVTVNCLSDSTLTLLRYNEDPTKYNLPLVESYKSKLISAITETDDSVNECVIRIPMPKRSLLVMYGSSRYQWEHCVLREDIKTRRVCVAYREFTPDYLPNGCFYDSVGDSVINMARTFWKH